MKPYTGIFLSILLLVGTGLLQGQTAAGGGQAVPVTQQLPDPTPYAVVNQDGNSRVWERTEFELAPDGTAVPKKHQFTELASGLNYKSSNGQWVESKEEIDLLPQGGAAATQGQHQAYFPGDIYQGVIKEVTPDGQQLQSRPLGLGYFDGTNTVLIAVLTNSVGVQISPNQVIYPNAFAGAGVDADLQYTYTKVGFEQDVILRAQPPAPEAFGLVSRNTRLQVLTEFFNAPQPKMTATVAGSLPDENLDFGVMKMAHGKAFLMGSGSPSVPVGKQWVRLQGRQFLVEEIPIAGVAKELDSLPMPTTQASSQTHLQMASKQLVLPPQRPVEADTTPLLVATASLPDKGFMLDYQTLNGSLTNYTFQGDTTFYISGNLNLYGTTTLEGGAVIKYPTNGPMMQIMGSFNCQTAPYRPAVFTSKDDNSVGESISGSSGVPAIDHSWNCFFLYFYDINQVNLHDLRISYSYCGITMQSGTMNLRDVQFVHNDYPVYLVDAQCSINNILMDDVQQNAFEAFESTNTVAQLTLDQCVQLWANDWQSTIALTNCLFTGLQSMGDASYVTNHVVSLSTNLNVFQTVGGGRYYLATNSPYRNAGTTNISPAALADIQIKTTYPPIAFTNVTFSVATNFSPQAQRDTNTPDLGYHYDPIDYAFGGCTANSNMNFSAGTVAGWFRTTSGWYHAGQGIHLGDQQVCNFNGTLAAPCYWVRLNTVQEQDLTAGYGPGGLTSWANQSGPYTNAAIVNAQFLHSTIMAGDDNAFRDDYGILIGNFTDCEFGTAGVGCYVSTYYVTNCLFDRSTLGNAAGEPGNQMYVRNCTFHGGLIYFNPYLNPVPITVLDSAFDGTVGSITSYGTYTNYASYSYNAFTNGSNPFPFGSSNVVITNGFNWQSSCLGNFYLPTNSPIIDKGNTTADQLGLYHFTTQTNQVPEASSTVDIGYHYVATDSNGNPLDSNGDGIPDYLEDANGNGIFDAGDLGEWQVSPYGLGGTNAFQVFTPLK